MPASEKVLKLKLRLATVEHEYAELSERARNLLQALKSGDSGLKCNDSSVVYHYAQLKAILKNN